MEFTETKFITNNNPTCWNCCKTLKNIPKTKIRNNYRDFDIFCTCDERTPIFTMMRHPLGNYECRESIFYRLMEAPTKTLDIHLRGVTLYNDIFEPQSQELLQELTVKMNLRFISDPATGQYALRINSDLPILVTNWNLLVLRLCIKKSLMWLFNGKQFDINKNSPNSLEHTFTYSQKIFNMLMDKTDGDMNSPLWEEIENTDRLRKECVNGLYTYGKYILGVNE